MYSSAALLSHHSFGHARWCLHLGHTAASHHFLCHFHHIAHSTSTTGTTHTSHHLFHHVLHATHTTFATTLKSLDHLHDVAHASHLLQHLRVQSILQLTHSLLRVSLELLGKKVRIIEYVVLTLSMLSSRFILPIFSTILENFLCSPSKNINSLGC